MPMFEYECPIHGVFERKVAIAARDAVRCSRLVESRSYTGPPDAPGVPIYEFCAYGCRRLVDRVTQTGPPGAQEVNTDANLRV